MAEQRPASHHNVALLLHAITLCLSHLNFHRFVLQSIRIHLFHYRLSEDDSGTQASGKSCHIVHYIDSITAHTGAFQSGEKAARGRVDDTLYSSSDGA